MINYCIPFEYKVGTPEIIIYLSKEINFNTLFVLPLIMGERYIPDFDAMTVH